jgi:pimeloyl-ACP methyl ester carboxylesterase
VIEFFDPIDTYLARNMIAMTPVQRAALVTYLETLREWNEMLNLTAIKDPAQMVTKHVLDSLTYLPFWATPPKRMIDVGTGAGIPGIIVHGRYDMLCRLEAAASLHQAWPGSELHIVREAGHAAAEPGISDALIRATQEMARILSGEPETAG